MVPDRRLLPARCERPGGRLAVAILAACITLALWALRAPPARAHGGAFGPPPPPVARGPRGPGGGGGPPSHVDPGFGGPIVTPGGGAPTAPGRASKRKTPITVTFETSWQLWWNLNREAWLPLRRHAAGGVVTPGAEGSAPAALGWERARRALAHDRAVPFLLGLLAPGSDQPDDVIASACIALGKLAHDKEAVAVLRSLLLDPARSGMVRESAALALGHLRRDDAVLRLPVRVIESVRHLLVQVFDGHVGGKRLKTPVRTRCFAMYAVGMLGDQPWAEDALSRDGRLLSKLLWERLAVPYKDRELHIALLLALGRQPAAGIPDGVQDGLRAIVAKKRALGHRWDLLKRAHAVATVARIGGVSGHAVLMRVAHDKRQPLVVRLAASIALAEKTSALSAAERGAALRVARKALDDEQQLLAAGLAHITYGRMVGADLSTGADRVLTFDKADAVLLQRVDKAPPYLRGWAALGLALAARGAPLATNSEPVRLFRRRARQALERLAAAKGGAPGVRGAAVVGLGLIGAQGSGPLLVSIARKTGLEPELRGHAALALGMIGGPGGAIEALNDLVRGEAPPRVVRGHAALALALLGQTRAAASLIGRLEADEDTRRLAAFALALGRLGHLAAAEPLITKAGDRKSRPLVRAMALVSLGRLLDPAPRPSLLRLTLGACYPARSRALQEAFTIL